MWTFSTDGATTDPSSIRNPPKLVSLFATLVKEASKGKNRSVSLMAASREGREDARKEGVQCVGLCRSMASSSVRIWREGGREGGREEGMGR